MGMIQKIKNKKTGVKRPLKWNMIGMLVLVWLLPLALASSVMFVFGSDKLKAHL